MSDNSASIIGLVILAGVALFATSANASISEYVDASGNPVDANGNPIDTSTPPYTPPTDGTMIDLTNYTNDQRLSALLAMIRSFEANNNYAALVGGGTFSSFAEHPATPGLPLPYGWKMNSAGTNYYNVRFNSSAAGAYQIIYSTWQSAAAALGLTDFSPASQDAAAAYILQQAGAVDALNNNDWQSAVQLASSQWASLPGSTAGQNPKSWATAENTYTNLIQSA